MEGTMTTEIIAVGTELLMGETADTSSGWLAQRLPELGLELHSITVVGDDLTRLTDTLERAWRRSDYVFTIGGLGPTEDDMTRDAVAKMLGEAITTDPELVRWLEERFRRRGTAPMPLHNLRQAATIPSADGVPNPLGTAPGWWVERDGKVLATMPGPPGEMMEMWNGELAPRLQARVIGSIIRTRTFKTIGLGEALVDEMVSHLYATEGLDLGCYAKSDGIYLRAIAKAATEAAALTVLDGLEREVRQALGPHLWGLDDETPQQRAGQLLREHGYTLAVLESCTGGLVAGAITEVPGSSAYFKGGTVTYIDDRKVAAGVDPKVIEAYGAVSHECAAAMAEAARRSHGTDCGIGVTGVAGPDDLEGNPPGLVYIGVSHPGGTTTSECRFPARRALVRGRAVTSALLALCQELQRVGSAAGEINASAEAAGR